MAHVHRPTGARLRTALLLTALILVVEVAAGLLSHSLALLSDAGHVLTDVAALALAWFAYVQSQRGSDEHRTYGYHRVGILVALFNAVTLLAIVAVIGYEAAIRLAHPVQVQGGIVMAGALAAIVVNIVIARDLHGEEGMNVRAVMLHVVGDMVSAVGVVVAAAIILLTGWVYVDPLISIGIAALIAWGAVRLVIDTVNVLMEATPRGLTLATVQAAMTSLAGVEAVHDLHVWSLSPDTIALSAHVVMSDRRLSEAEAVVRQIEREVCDRFGIAHTTIQVESEEPCVDGALTHMPGAHNHPH